MKNLLQTISSITALGVAICLFIAIIILCIYALIARRSYLNTLSNPVVKYTPPSKNRLRSEIATEEKKQGVDNIKDCFKSLLLLTSIAIVLYTACSGI